jgi:tRNA 2-thiouridine synthesizing protein D
MKFSLLILGSPYSDQSVSTALRFARTAIDKGHAIYRIFFYHNGVNCGNQLISPPQDENNIPALWSELAQAHDIDMVVCVGSALRRGVLDKTEAERYEKNADNLADNFEISGLGQLVEATIISDRVVTFGS